MSKDAISPTTEGHDLNHAQEGEFEIRSVPSKAIDSIRMAADEVGGAYKPLPVTGGADACTHFDTPSSQDHHLTVLLTKENMDRLPSQTLVRINSLDESGKVEHAYLGVVVAGPFAEPDGLRADSPIVVATTVQGRIFLPRYHGRVHLQILGEESGGQLVPPRWRPRPNSPVFPLDLEETERVLKVGGEA